MNNYKKRLKLRHYAKSGVDLLSKDRKIKIFFNPSLIYARFSSNLKLEDYFKKSLLNHRKAKSYFGFHKTSFLKKIIKKNFLKKTKYKYLKEIELCSILERRLDLILLRVGFVSNLFEAKQLISHKKILINGVKSKCFTTILKRGDIISIDPSAKNQIQTQLRNTIERKKSKIFTFDNIEVSLKNLKIIVIKKKIKILKHFHHYEFFLNWQIFFNRI
jgi:ribosomal protein S4